MGKAQDAAQWMLDEVKRDPPLYQQSAVWEIEKRFGSDLVVVNNNGNPAIHPDVLAAFRQLSKGGVVWSKYGRYWRLRQSDEPTDKRQVPY